MTFFEERMSEADLLAHVLEAAARGGWKVAHFRDSRHEIKPGVFVGDPGARGWPDLVLARGRRLMVRELKTEKGPYRPGQREWLAALVAAGVDAATWRPSDLPEIDEELLSREE